MMARAYGFLTLAALLSILAGNVRDSHADDSLTAASEGQLAGCLPDLDDHGHNSIRPHGDTQTSPCPIASDDMPIIITPPVWVTVPLEPNSPRRHEVLEFLRQLHRKIAESQHYPLNARKLGLEGTAMIAFNLMPDGNAHAMRIRQTSGHSLLDEAALDAVQRVLPFKPPLKAGSPPLELTVPIGFTLR